MDLSIAHSALLAFTPVMLYTQALHFSQKNHNQINNLVFNSQGFVLLQTFPDLHIRLQLGHLTLTVNCTVV